MSSSAMDLLRNYPHESSTAPSVHEVDFSWNLISHIYTKLLGFVATCDNQIIYLTYIQETYTHVLGIYQLLAQLESGICVAILFACTAPTEYTNPFKSWFLTLLLLLHFSLFKNYLSHVLCVNTLVCVCVYCVYIYIWKHLNSFGKWYDRWWCKGEIPYSRQ